MTIGLDRAIGDHALLGVAAGLGWADVDHDGSTSALDAGYRSFALYGLLRGEGRWFADAVLGWGRLDFDIVRESSTAMFVNFGGTVRPNLLIGGEINGWAKSENDADWVVSSLMAVAHYYPSVTNGLFISGGLGFTQGSIDDGVDELTSSGVGIQLGGGYDWRVAKSFSLTPYVQYVRAFAAEAKLNDTGLGEDLNPNFFQVGLGFTWH